MLVQVAEWEWWKVWSHCLKWPEQHLQLMNLKNNLPYLHNWSDSSGITASHAMLGDIHIAEPGALIAFAGAAIQGTVKEELPEGFQRSEYVENWVCRHNYWEKNLSEKIRTLLSILLKKNLL